MYLQNKTCVFIYRKQEDFMEDWKYQWEDTVITGLTSSNRSSYIRLFYRVQIFDILMVIHKIAKTIAVYSFTKSYRKLQ